MGCNRHEGCSRWCELALHARDEAKAKRRICKQPRYTHRSPHIKRLSREAIREQLARMIHDGWSGGGVKRQREKKGRETRGIGRAHRRREEDCGKEKRANLFFFSMMYVPYTYIMQMVPIINRVYNRSTNLLTAGRKDLGESRTARGGVFTDTLVRTRVSHSLTNDRIHTTVDKCILLAYHLYAWAFFYFLSQFSISFSRFLPSELT